MERGWTRPRSKMKQQGEQENGGLVGTPAARGVGAGKKTKIANRRKRGKTKRILGR